jgi:hypothetical protein
MINVNIGLMLLTVCDFCGDFITRLVARAAVPLIGPFKQALNR